MKVYVVMGNDYPDAVYRTNEAAEAHCARERLKDEQAGRKVYWRVYDFPLLGIPPQTRTDDHDTSIAAAASIKPITGKIAREVLAYASRCAGFTDSSLRHIFPGHAESSYRKRRTELTQEGYLEATDQRQSNDNGRDEIVWRITDKGRMAL